MTSNAAFSDAPFDVRQFARTARGNHRADLRLDEYESAPLSPETLRSLQYLSRLESATMEQLRNLLVTATHKDARVTAFLVTWAFEKFWIADALDAISAANGMPREQEEAAPKRRRGESSDRRGPIKRAISAMTKGAPIVTVHVTMGYVDELVTRAAYEELAESANSELLGETIAMILDIHSRHADFFERETRRRLAEDAQALAQTRKVLPHTSFPIGAVDRAAADRARFDSEVFGGDRGKAVAVSIGERVASMPGLGREIGDAVATRLSA